MPDGPPELRTIRTDLLPRRFDTIRSLHGLTTNSSGVAIPLTTASPSPQLALIRTSSVAVFIGLAVNTTPATSESTIRCTTTAIDESRWS